MKRRDFLTAAAGGAGMLLTPRSALEALARMSPAAPWLLVPMDEVQADHLKAYGVAFRPSSAAGRSSGSSTTGAARSSCPEMPRRCVIAPSRASTRSRRTTARLRACERRSSSRTWTRCRSRRRRRSRVCAAQRGTLGRCRYHGAQLRRREVRQASGTARSSRAGSRSTTGSTCTTKTSPASTPSSC